VKVISFYSFKGGTGRTTTAANVAADLARRNKNVVVIDLDIDGPGLEIVFGANNIPLYIQDFIKSPSSSKFDELLFDLKTEERFQKLKGALYFIAANLDVQAPVQATSDVVHDIVSVLLRRLKESVTPQFDYCIVDSQSGYTDLSATVLDISDHLFLLSRFSRQHVIGTVAYSQFLAHLITKSHLRLRYDVIMSLVPPTNNKSERKLKDSYLKAIEENLAGGVLVQIPESASLKWREEVVIDKRNRPDSDTIKAFCKIAERCIGLG
jgi:MinD-like ATPase involved in chromosome partitioning or flagellar assembly